MQRQTTRLRAHCPLPGTPISLVRTIGLTAAVAPDLPTYCRWRPSEVLGDLPDRPAHRNATGNLFAFLKPECYQSPLARRRLDPAKRRVQPVDATLLRQSSVAWRWTNSPVERQNLRHRLFSLSTRATFAHIGRFQRFQLSLLLRREPRPCIPFVCLPFRRASLEWKSVASTH